MTSTLLTRLARVRRDDGFGLVEAIIALSIAAVIFTALAYAAIGAIRASMVSRQTQQAIDVATQQLEQMRQLPYAGLGHVVADLTGDAAVTSCGSNKCFDPGTGTAEKVVVLASGGFAPHITTKSGLTTNNTTFTLKTYITKPVDNYNSDYRRVTVVVSWQSGSLVNTKRISTLVTYTQRGLPLPVFKFITSTASPQSVNPTADAAFLFQLSNQGAPDRWDITRSGTTDWKFFLDDGDGQWVPADDTTALVDTDGNGTIDTDLIAPSGSVSFWAVWTTLASTPVATYPVNFTATSAAQPLATSGSSTIAASVKVYTGSGGPSPSATPPPTTPICAAATAVPNGVATGSYSLKKYFVHNRSSSNPSWPPSSGPAPNTTATGQGIPLTAEVDTVQFPAMSDPPVYTDDISPSGTSGRIIPATSGSQLLSTDPKKVVDWLSNSTGKVYSGTAVVRFWIAAVTGSPLTTLNTQLQLYTVVAGTRTALNSPTSLTASFTCSGGWQEVWATVPVSVGNSGKAGRQLGVRVWNNGTNPIRIAYDTGSFPASLTLPEK